MIELEHDGDEDFDSSSDSELPEDITCKHCGRVVLLGPPCCYKKLYEFYVASQKEVQWLRKIQSRQEKKIQAIKKDLSQVELVVLISIFILIGVYLP